MEQTEKPNPDATMPPQSRNEEEEKATASSSTAGSVTVSKDLSVENTDPVVLVEDEQKYLTGLKLLVTMISITLVGFLFLLDTSIVSTAIPRITSDFHSLDDVGWYGTAYLLANCALTPLTGKVYTYFSNKWTFLSFFAVFELGSVLCGAATSSKMLIVGRAVAGMGASGLLNGAYTIVHASVAPAKQAGLQGILIGISQLGLLCGPLIGGALTQHVSWRWCFYINLPCGAVVALLLVFIALPDHSGKSTETRTVGQFLAKLDVIGFAIFAGASIQLLLALNWGGIDYSWSSSTIIGLFCGAGGVLLVFLPWEYYKGNEAMIPFSLIGRHVVWSSCVNYGFFAGCLLTSTYYLPIYFQAVRNATPTLSGVDLLPSILGNMLFAILTGGLVGRIGYYLPFGVASGVLTIIGSGLLTTLTPTSPNGKWIGYQILQGAGRGFGLQIPILAVQNNSNKGEVSILTALVVFSQQFGGAVFLSLAQVIFGTSLRHNLAFYAPDVNAEAVITAGATAVRSAVSAASLPGVLLAYTKAFDHVMYLTTGAAGGALLFAFGMGWVKMNEKEVTAEVTSEEKEV
ncbi:MAG: hypothetical protein MMC33_006950 [Icmadophila ericetorum]|nr:hypothetical protein [Icmadophila ericetorum]